MLWIFNISCWGFQEMEYAIEGHFIIAKRNTDNEDLTAVGGITIKQFKEIYALRVGKAVCDHFL